MSLKLIVFDFDGVLIDSNAIKFDAWRSIFQSRSFQEQTAVQTVLATSREASRYDILAAVAAEIGLAEDERVAFVRQMADRYQTETEARMQAVYDPAIEVVLAGLAVQFPLVISSATPTLSLRQKVGALGLERWFEQVLGSPPGKTERLQSLIVERRIDAHQVLVVGDGESDRRSADINRCQFVGIANAFNGWSVGTGIDLLPSVLELPAFLTQRGLR